MLLPILLAAAAGVLLSIPVSLYRAFDRGGDAYDYVLLGSIPGAIAGVIVGGIVAIVHIARLSRPGGPLHSPAKPRRRATRRPS